MLFVGMVLMDFREFFVNNRWWGKLIGCFFGYLIGNSIGALFGILIGNFFDKGLNKHFSRTNWHYFAEKQQQVQKKFFEAVFSVMGHIAKANGRVSQNHIQMALHLMNEMKLNQQQQELAKQYFNAGKETNFDINQTLYDLGRSCHNNKELLKLFMDIQYKSAQVDGLSTKKIELLDSIFKQMGFAPLHQQYRFYEDLQQRWGNGSQQSQSQRPNGGGGYQSRQQAPSYGNHADSKLRESYAILEVSLNATKPEVKRAYRRIVSKNHPDKLIAKGLPEALIKVANAKTQSITKAYEYICEQKGW